LCRREIAEEKTHIRIVDKERAHAGERRRREDRKTQRGEEEEAQSRGQTEMDLFPHLRPW